MPFAYIHSCGKPAFYLETMPKSGDTCDSSKATMQDGSKPTDGSEIVCGSCGGRLANLSIRNFKEVVDAVL